MSFEGPWERVLCESTCDPQEASRYRESPLQLLWPLQSPPLLSRAGRTLTNAREVQHSCGHGDILIVLVVGDRNLWRQHPAPMGALEGRGARAGP